MSIAIAILQEEALIYAVQNDLYSEWRPFYIDYNLLKRELKVKSPPPDPFE